ncbi:hypothetical protein BX666DRAFT_1535473 [Dichotomocladium elegans]|nr:hypothetical protein BX666DRAFT_1535473 [Dichotomocladium elegans]
MFAKSKRFPEGNKDILPGPGDYNVLGIPLVSFLGALDSARHVLSCVIWWNKMLILFFLVDLSGDIYPSGAHSIGSLSSETMSTVSNKTEDARGRRQVSEMAAQFEKYRHAMQKEIESLQHKNRKLEASISTAASEKDAIQSQLFTKDQELAEMRLKNASLQKTLTRLEKGIDKAPKVIQMQKRIDQLEKELDVSRAEAVKTREDAQQHQEATNRLLETKAEAIETLEEQVAHQRQTISDLADQIETGRETLKSVQDQHKATLGALHTELQGVTDALGQTKELLAAERASAATLADRIGILNTNVETLRAEKADLERTVDDMAQRHQAELAVCKTEREQLEHVIVQLQGSLQQSADAMSELETQLKLQKHECDALHQTNDTLESRLVQKQELCHKFQAQFDIYRNHVTHLLRDMREKTPDDTRLSHELQEAKKFINHQALQIEGLKSEIHWMTKWNRKLSDLIDTIHHDDIAQGWPTGCKVINDSGFLQGDSSAKA